jgi:all-trans-8'-apo-beta-carotenal 15,15'-oxygenase
MSWHQRSPIHLEAPSWLVHEIEGEWPRECSGTLLRNGPALFERDGHRKHHLFDGDGFAQAWDFKDGTVSHRAAWIQTKKFREEQSSGRFLYPGFADNDPSYRPFRSPDDLNTANTNLIHWNGKLLALWEGGSAHELDFRTLETIGVKIWSTETQAAPFGAHPKRDKDGRLWNVGISNNQLLIYVINSDDSLARLRLHAVRPCALVHDFFLTTRFLGVWLAPIQLNSRDALKDGDLLSAMKWQEQDGSLLVLIDRNDLEIFKIIELESELIFHFANAWEEDEELKICCITNTFQQLRSDLSPSLGQSISHGHQGAKSYVQFRHIQLSSGVSNTIWKGQDQVEFPQIDERIRGKPCNIMFSLLASNSEAPSTFNGLIKQDVGLGQTKAWTGGGEFEMEEHVYVPKHKTDPSAGGWLIGSGFHSQRQQSFCSIFEADQLERGPIAIAYLEGPAPLVLHGQFVAST